MADKLDQEALDYKIAGCSLLAVRMERLFGIEPKRAVLSHSNFGSSQTKSAKKIRDVVAKIRALDTSLEIDGEIHSDAAKSQAMPDILVPDSKLSGQVNLLIMPSLDAANISFNELRMLADGVAVGPMLVGMAQPAHILQETVCVRGHVNMTALAVVEAQLRADTEAQD
ncbi:MAG: phosphate acyltransferase [Rhodospirillales bacterium]|nr:phosphate acyltransferase [Rhodospirillales bacterium]